MNPVRIGILFLVALLSWSLVPFANGTEIGFLRNEGQVDQRVLYYATGSGGSVCFTADAVILDLRRDDPSIPPSAFPEFLRGVPVPERNESGGGCVLRIRFDGAAPTPLVGGIDPLSVRFHFLKGNDAARWQTNLLAYARVTYYELWPGTDLSFTVRDGELIYETRSAHPEEPPKVRFRYEGADRVIPLPDGVIRIETPAGCVVALPSATGEGNGRFRLESETLGGGRDDSSALLWSALLGGSSPDQAAAVCMDSLDNPVVIGRTASFNFRGTPGSYDPEPNGDWDVFVAKLSAGDGGTVWSTMLGGTGGDGGYGLCLDAEGNVAVAGYTYSADFPVTPGAFDESYQGGGFAARLSATGDRLIWSTFLGGTGDTYINSLALDGAGSVIVGGMTGAPDFPTTPGAFDDSFNGALDAFVTRFSQDGTALIGSTYLGGSGVDGIFGLALDDSANPIVTGQTSSADYPVSGGAFDPSIGGPVDSFVSKLSNDTRQLLWSTYLGGSDHDIGFALVVGSDGDPIVTGKTSGVDFPTTPGAFDPTPNGSGQAFVTRLDAGGGSLAWSTVVGGFGNSEGKAIALDAWENPVIVGTTDCPDFPTTPEAYDTSFNGLLDAYVTRLSASGESLIGSTFLGGRREDGGFAVCVGTDGNPVLAGQTQSLDFPMKPGTRSIWSRGDVDAFLSRITLPESHSTPGKFQPEDPGRTVDAFVGPNPCRGGTTIFYRPAERTEVGMIIFDVRGKRVRALQAEGGSEPGPFHWNGCDDLGGPVPSGTYFAIDPHNPRSGAVRIVVVR